MSFKGLALFIFTIYWGAYVYADATKLIKPDILETLNSFNHYLENTQLTTKTCRTDLPKILSQLRKTNPENFHLNKALRDFEPIMQSSFKLKQNLRNQLKRLSHPGCVSAIREALVIARYFEDYFLVQSLEPIPFNEKTDPKAGPLLMGPKEALQKSTKKAVTLKSGDLLLSRGNAYTSAAISRIGENPAQFSHLSQVYIDAPIGTEIPIAQALKDPRVYTIEAHIEVGSFTRSFAKYAQDGNARVALFRFRGTARDAHYAARYIYDYVTLYQKKKMELSGRRKYTVNDNPPYDFAMNSLDRNEIFCAEIISMAYNSRGILLPMHPTRLKNNFLTQTMGITAQSTFAPADIEIDPNFEFLAEWRDLRKTPAILKKDVALSAMYEWMQNHQYKFYYNLLDYVKAQIAWTARQLDLGFSERLPKNMEKQVVRMTFAIDRVGEKLERELNEYEKDQFRRGRKFRALYPEQMQVLERFRMKDQKAYQEDRRGLFHGFHHTFRK